MPTVHLLIKGKVQGVFYRVSARETAEKLQIKGWVKNTDSGDVEAIATGTNQQLQEFIAWCKQGPQRAVVSEVIATNQEETFFKDFSVIR